MSDYKGNHLIFNIRLFFKICVLVPNDTVFFNFIFLLFNYGVRFAVHITKKSTFNLKL